MNLKEQSYVCTLARTGSISTAAKLLEISQPALTLYIQNLERNLGVRLFDRVGKRFVLTYPGQLSVDTACKMLELKERFDGQLSSIFADYSGRLRLGIQDTRSSYLFPRIIERFNAAHINIEVRLQERRIAELMRQLRSNEIDVALCNRPRKMDDMEWVPIHEDGMKLMVSREWDVVTEPPRVAGGLPWVDLKQFADRRFILSPVGYSARERMDEIMRSQGFKPTETMDIQKISTHVTLVSRGYGVGFIQPSYVRENGLEHLVAQYDVTTEQSLCQFGAMFLKGRQLPEYVQTVIEIAGGIMRDSEEKK